MRTLVLEPPPELQSWLERRRALGQDLYDEVWEGEYVVAPAPRPAHADLQYQIGIVVEPLARAAGLRGHGPINIGDPDDYRVPDQSFLRERPQRAFVSTAAIVVEITSPGDKTWDKPPFYFARGVEELLIVDPGQRRVHWRRRGANAFVPADRTALLDLSAQDLTDRLDWPPV